MDTQELLKRESRVNIEQWCQRNAQAVYVADGTVLCRVLGKYLMYVLSRDISVAPHLMLDGYWEIWITMAIAQYIKPGMRCVDAGAHVGYYSVLLSDWVGAAGEVIAIEPAPLQASVLLSNLERVPAQSRVVHAAAWDAVGKQTLVYDGWHSGDNHLAREGEALEEVGPMITIIKRTKTVLTVRLDDEVEGAVDFIKLDIEGSEAAAWRGMRELLQRSPNVQIAAEWTRKYDPNYELLALAAEDGFKPHEIMGDGKLRPLKGAVDLADASVDWRMLWFKR